MEGRIIGCPHVSSDLFPSGWLREREELNMPLYEKTVEMCLVALYGCSYFVCKWAGCIAEMIRHLPLVFPLPEGGWLQM